MDFTEIIVKLNYIQDYQTAHNIVHGIIIAFLIVILIKQLTVK